MSTRGMIGIRVNGNLLGFYNHFDSYPDGLGEAMVGWVATYLKGDAKATFAKNAAALKNVKEDKNPPKKWFDYYMALEAKENGSDQREQIGGAQRAKAEWYGLLRNYQGVNGLDAILSGELKHFVQYSTFLEDSLFCEYAYILDMDRGVMEFYEGFQSGEGSDKYGPCKKVGELPFGKVTVKGMLKFYPKETADAN